MKFLLAVVSAMALMVQPCFAQTAPPADSATAPADAPIDAARLAAAHRMVAALHLDEAMHAMLAAMIPRMTQDMSRAQGMTAAQGQIVSAAVLEETQADLPDLIELFTTIYAREFSEDDMNATAAFYESGPGRHFVEAQGRLAEEGAAIAQAWSQRLQPRVAARVRAMMAHPAPDRP